MKIKNTTPGITTVVYNRSVMINKHSDGTFTAGYIGRPLYKIKGRVTSKIYEDTWPWACNYKKDAKVYSNYRDVWKVDGCIRYGIVIIDDDTGKITFYKCNNEEETEFISDEGVIVEEAYITYGAEMMDGDWVDGQYKLGYIKTEDKRQVVFSTCNEIPANSWEDVLYEDDEIRIKKSFKKYYLEYEDKEYEIRSMIQDGIKDSDFKKAKNVYRTFLPNAKIMTEWERVTYSDNTNGLEINDPDTGEKKFYWYLVKEGKPYYLAEDGERQIYEANVICSGSCSKTFLVGFVEYNGLDPEKCI